MVVVGGVLAGASLPPAAAEPAGAGDAESAASALGTAQVGRTFHIDGGGWGHGVGMSQYGAYGRAQAGQSAEQILAFYYHGAQVQALPMPSGLRIWIGESDGVNGVVVTAGSQPMIVQAATGVVGFAAPGVSPRITISNGSLRIADDVVPGVDRFWIDLDPSSPVTVAPGGGQFGRGRLEVILVGGALRIVVSNLTMQNYLYGLSEVPSSWPREALRAQAIAGRTYAAEKISRTGLDRPDCSCSLVGTQGDQVYAGMAKETGPFGAQWKDAVDSTDSVVVTFGGAPIQAFYSSSNGGYTEASQDGFVTALPYLIAQPDPFDAVGPDFHWSRDYSQSELSRWLGAQGDTNVGTVLALQVLDPLTGSGRVGRVVSSGRGGVLITGTGGTRQVSGQRFQSVVNAGVFGDGGGYERSLKSTLFSVDGFAVYDPNFRGGVMVAAGRDVGGAPRVITGAGPGGGPDVSVFDANGTRVRAFYAYDAGFGGGISVAACDLDGDGVDEIVTGAGPGGGPDVSVFDINGNRRLAFYAYDAGFRGGVFVACGDLDGDGRGEIVTGAGLGGGPDVSVFSAGGQRLRAFYAYDPGFIGGVRVAVTDPDGPGGQAGRIISGAGPGGGPDVGVFTAGGSPLVHFYAYEAAFGGGVFVAGGDVRGDAAGEIVTGPGEGGGPRVGVFSADGARLVDTFAFSSIPDRGARVAVGPFPQGRLVVASGAGARPIANILAV
jgi:peptidoglycan hydrolase-like amidase